MSHPITVRACTSLSRSSRAPSTAALFLSQCRRSLSTSWRLSNPHKNIPDFLLPSFEAPSKRVRWIASPNLSSFTRRFSTSPISHQTSVLLNPRIDDSGSPMTIDISPRAATRLQQITSASTPQSISHLGSLGGKLEEAKSDHLRVSVTSGGCHGFQYLMSLEPAEKISEEEDTVFVAQEGGKKSGDEEGKAVVVMDEPSLELLRGSTIDYTMELIGSQFKVTGNPRAKSSCGCGTSFDVDD